MKLRYGTYTHDADEVNLSISRSNTFENNVQTGYTEMWRIDGILQNTSQAGITADINALKAAYSVNGRTAVLLFDNLTETAHKLDNNATISGVQVVTGPEFPTGTGAEYSTFRTYSIELKAEFLVTNNVGTYDFQESLTLSGGGPRDRHIVTLTGPPPKQRLVQQTIYKAVQTGLAVGHRNWPNPPPPLFPADELRDLRSITHDDPDNKGNGFERYTVRWTYEYERSSPFGRSTPNIG